MSERLDRGTFIRTYVKMAKEGKSALAIAEALGVNKPTDTEKAQFVSQKASNYRKQLRSEAVVMAEKQGLDENATKELVESTAAKLPKLSTRTRTASNLSSFLTDLLDELDAPTDGGDEDESTEAPE